MRFKKGDKILRIAPRILAPELMKCGKVYTFDRYEDHTIRGLFVEEIDTGDSFDSDKFISANSYLIKEKLGVK